MTIKEVNFNYLLKYIIIGNSSVGKSCITMRYIHESFAEEFTSTIGVEYGSKNITINGKIYKIQIWDTAGQENFRSITRAYYKNSICACIVYDITNRKSFEDVKLWLEDCKSQSPRNILLVLIGNKIDLEDKREVSFEEGEKFAKENNMMFLETSAKNGDNIENIFYNSAAIIDKKIEEKFYDLNVENCGIKIGINPPQVISLNEKKIINDKNSGFCC